MRLKKSILFRCAGVLAAGFLACAALPASAVADDGAEPLSAEDCRVLAGEAEREHRIPAQLLSAISMAEAGTWDADRQASIAWPWTVYAEGKGTYHPDKETAIAAVKQLRQRGVRNIDVGCMQVNLHYHGKAFENLEQALDPRRNIEYAATFLTNLQQEHRSWTEAVARYHSSTRSLNQPYKLKVMELWHAERRAYGERRRAAVMAAYNERRERMRQIRENRLKLAEN